MNVPVVVRLMQLNNLLSLQYSRLALLLPSISFTSSVLRAVLQVYGTGDFGSLVRVPLGIFLLASPCIFLYRVLFSI